MKLKRHVLTDLLTYRRPARSKSEKEMIARFIDAVPGMRHDAFGNRILRIGADPTTMISCHTDTVHTTGGRQVVHYNWKTGDYTLDKPAKPKVEKNRFMKTPSSHFRDCLGADDGAGIFAALSMIAAKVPALYVFHRSEEIGGLGSDFIASRHVGLLDGIRRCIALDRRGTSDIITHQMCGRCCSDVFADAFAELLGMEHKACPFGSFTDSANYVDFVGECTNLSIGYEHEHSGRESLNWDYLSTVVEQLCTVNLDTLPTVRWPGEIEDWRDMNPRKVVNSASRWLPNAADDLDNWPAGALDVEFTPDWAGASDHDAQVIADELIHYFKRSQSERLDAKR